MQIKILKKKQNNSMTSTELDSSSRKSLKNSGNNWQNLTQNLNCTCTFFKQIVWRKLNESLKAIKNLVIVTETLFFGAFLHDRPVKQFFYNKCQ